MRRWTIDMAPANTAGRGFAGLVRRSNGRAGDHREVQAQSHAARSVRLEPGIDPLGPQGIARRGGGGNRLFA